MRVDQRLSDKIRGISLLCSLLICFNHTYTVPSGFTDIAHEPFAFSLAFIENTVKFGFARISTPFFFAVAGFMLFSVLYPEGLKGWPWFPFAKHRTEITKRFRSLALPFLLVSVWSFALIYALQAIPGLPGQAVDPLAQRSGPRLIEALLWNPVAYPLWFLRNLILLCVAAPLIALVIRYRAVAFIALACAVAAWFAWFEIRATRSIPLLRLRCVPGDALPAGRIRRPHVLPRLVGLVDRPGISPFPLRHRTRHHRGVAQQQCDRHRTAGGVAGLRPCRALGAQADDPERLDLHLLHLHRP